VSNAGQKWSRLAGQNVITVWDGSGRRRNVIAGEIDYQIKVGIWGTIRNEYERRI
jgi:hypothetical protein